MIGALLAMLDAWHVNEIGVSVPQLTHLWHLPGSPLPFTQRHC
jgi:hypothetical protein